MFTPSPQQKSLFDWIVEKVGSVFVRARAGTGKTTTLIEACKLLRGSVLFVAYNKKIVEEIKVRLAALGLPNLEAATFHSVGFKAVRKVYPRTRCDDRTKRDRICNEVGIPASLQGFVFKLVSQAKNRAIMEADIGNDALFWDIVDHFSLLEDLEDESLADEAIKYAQAALRCSIRIAPDVIDFDDMIYLPVIKGMKVQQYDNLLIDEAQDTNECRRALAAKLLVHGGRGMWVGDDRQSIYGFTGADADAVNRIIEGFNCEVLPLSVTYRCPKAIVREAQKIVPDYEAHPSAPEGIVRTIKQSELDAQNLTATDAILCRKMAPLVEQAFALIRKNIACHVEGRDIGQGLLKLVTRWKITNVARLIEKLDEYCEREVEKLVAKKRDTQAEALKDRVETVKVLAQGCETVACIKEKIENLFSDSDRPGYNKPTLTLSTIHRSKGREWDRVFVLGYNQFQPSKWARQAWEVEQEKNLQYVAITRAKAELAFVDHAV